MSGSLLPKIADSVVIKGAASSSKSGKQQMSGRNALAFKIFEKALKGDPRAIEILRETDREVAHDVLKEQQKQDEAAGTGKSDKEIIAHFLRTRTSVSSKNKGDRHEK